MTPDIQIRPFKTADFPFVVSSWLKSYKMMSYFARKVPHRIFFGHHKRVIAAILDSPMVKVYVAVSPDDDDQIIGYLVASAVRSPHEDRQCVVIQYLFVKREFQRLGIATKLIGILNIKQQDEVSYTHLCRLWSCSHRAPLPPAIVGFCNQNYCKNDSTDEWIAKKYPNWVYNPYLI